MTEQEYQQLNSYLNLFFLELSKEDSFLLENLTSIYNLSVHYTKIIEQYDLTNQQVQNNLTYEKIFIC